jgi:hypothetical protein
VRELERTIGKAARKVARRFAEGHAGPVTVSPDDLPDLLGPERVRPERFRKELQPGVATGLAWTEAGGDLLYIEASLLRDARGVRLTGQLGKVMKESARAALSFVWSHAEALGIDPSRFRHEPGRPAPRHDAPPARLPPFRRGPQGHAALPVAARRPPFPPLLIRLPLPRPAPSCRT